MGIFSFLFSIFYAVDFTSSLRFLEIPVTLSRGSSRRSALRCCRLRISWSYSLYILPSVPFSLGKLRTLYPASPHLYIASSRVGTSQSEIGRRCCKEFYSSREPVAFPYLGSTRVKPFGVSTFQSSIVILKLPFL